MPYLRILAIFVLVFIIFSLFSSMTPTPMEKRQHYLIPSQVQGHLAVPEDEFLPIMEKADQRMDELFDDSRTLNKSQRLLTWFSLSISCLVTIIAGFFGKKVNITSDEEILLEQVLEKSQSSMFYIRAIGLLLALSTASGFLSQQLKADAMATNVSAKELNQKIIDVTEIIYSDSSKEIDVRLALRDLKVKMGSI